MIKIGIVVFLRSKGIKHKKRYNKRCDKKYCPLLR